MKNVLIVITVPFSVNGIVVATRELIENLDQDKFKVFVVRVGGDDKNVEQSFTSLGAKIIRLPMRNTNPIKYYRELKRAIREYNIDVVHAMGNSATLAVEMAAAKAEKVSLRIAHSHNTTCKHKLIDRLLRPSLYKNCNCRLSCGTDAGIWLFGKRPFIVFKNGKTFEKYAYSADHRIRYRKHLGCEDKTFLIGHSGGFNEQKNHSFIVDIAKILADRGFDFKMIFLGDGKTRRAVEDKINALGLSDKFVFCGNVDNSNEINSAFDLAILPSKFEGLPNVATEWQINGLPCLFSDKVTPECGINQNVEFLPVDDAARWANEIEFLKLTRLTDENEIRKNLVESGFDIVENAERLSKIYMGGVCDQSGEVK